MSQAGYSFNFPTAIHMTVSSHFLSALTKKSVIQLYSALSEQWTEPFESNVASRKMTPLDVLL